MSPSSTRCRGFEHIGGDRVGTAEPADLRTRAAHAISVPSEGRGFQAGRDEGRAHHQYSDTFVGELRTETLE